MSNAYATKAVLSSFYNIFGYEENTTGYTQNDNVESENSVRHSASSMNASSPLPLLAHDELATTLAQIEVSRMLLCFTVGTWMYDALYSLSEEVHILVNIGVKMCDLIYILSRLTTGAAAFSMLIFNTGPVNDCNALAKFGTWIGAFATTCNALIFFLRTRAVFFSSPTIRRLLTVLWCGTLGIYSVPFFMGGLPTLSNTNSTVLANTYTKTCVFQDITVRSISMFDLYVSTGPAMMMVHDTIMYLAVGIKLTKDRITMTSKRKSDLGELKAFFSGAEMGDLAKALVVSGQVYYLITAASSITTLICVLSPSISDIVRHSIPVHNNMIHNNMACRLYRRIKLEGIRDGSPKYVGGWGIHKMGILDTSTDSESATEESLVSP
ncbi:hypothetical protein C8Q75DRAFT_469834 [Abortiporus biennis]|nr:hypothetical protein C8Q75DRAFT_469834 [Abortiporus biennis]